MRVFRLFAHTLVLLATVACGPAPTVTSQLSEAEARAIAENALKALEAGDFGAWSRDWSDTMKATIKEPTFQAFRDQVSANYGRYLSTANIELIDGTNPGYIRWNALADFERGRLRFGFGFKRDGTTVEGVFPEPVN